MTMIAYNTHPFDYRDELRRAALDGFIEGFSSFGMLDLGHAVHKPASVTLKVRIIPDEPKSEKSITRSQKTK